MISNVLENLNEEQEKAVKHHKGPLLILAGAGSGKTRVLTHRIAYLMEEYHVNPWNILALTFTNKAAKEMRERVDRIVEHGAENIWVGTFHSTCVRILRRFIDLVGYDRNFSIYDADDQRNLMKDVCKYLNLDTKKYGERKVLSYISSAKDELVSPEAFEKDAANPNERTIAKAYREYQKRLKSNNALDFDDLIVKTVELFRSQPDVLDYYRNRFRYILVDEYQDTNSAQFHLIHLMAHYTNECGEVEKNVCVVGDDDQSIYKFRGANIHNILNFEKVYPDAKVIKLEQNYRSTQNILDAANEVIKNNTARKDKALWSKQDKGDLIFYTRFQNDFEEADSIVKDIKNGVDNGGAAYNEFAILYRTNAQSRSFEEHLVASNIPYKIVGALNFYSRKEIKDCIAYLKTIDNGLDDLAVKRIINVPRRGIGLTTIECVTRHSMENEIGFYEALGQVDSITDVKRNASTKIKRFLELIEGFKKRLNDPAYSIESLMKDILEETGYLPALEEEGTDEAGDRIENIQEFINRIHIYEQREDGEATPSLSGFLEEIALVADIDNVSEDGGQVLLMTLHSAKGLEFPYVYICGMEDNIFPSSMAIYSPDITDLEEERRLCYVGITRAMKKLSISCAKQRMRNGELQYNPPSRFISEIPRFLIKQTIGEGRLRDLSNQASDYDVTTRNDALQKTEKKTQTPMSRKNPSKNLFSNNPYIQKGFQGSRPQPLQSLDYSIGDAVKHGRFGIGTVKELNAIGNDYEVLVDFEGFGNRKMKASFAKLQKI